MANIKMRKTAMTLHYREEKPIVYKLRQVKYPAIKHKNLIKYISNTANLPETTVSAAVAAIAEAILYFTINGHRVSFNKFGGFYINVNCKTKTALEDLKIEDVVKSMALRYAPATDLREAISDTGTTIVVGGAYDETPDNG